MRKRDASFKFKVGSDERQMIAILAERLQRSQSDAVRLVIREAVRSLEPTTITPPTSPQPTMQQEAHA
jgi:hypothetical protein